MSPGNDAGRTRALTALATAAAAAAVVMVLVTAAVATQQFARRDDRRRTGYRVRPRAAPRLSTAPTRR